MSEAFKNAARYAEELGFKVFPIQAGGKVPLTRNGFKDATSDANQINAWGREFPKANWAVATGSESGVYVVDPDTAEADAWYESQWIPEGISVKTPRGRHIYFSYDGDGVDLGITNGSIHKGLDTRGNGGYVLLPGSHTSSKVNAKYADGEYVGDLFQEMPAVPEALIELIPEKQYFESLPREAFDALQEADKPSTVSPQEERVLRGLTDLLDALPVPWHDGAGYHSTGFYVACSLHRVANSPDYATTEAQAYDLYMKHVPIRPEDEADIWDVRWTSAKKQTDGQIADPPGDTPVRLDAVEILDRLNVKRINDLFWDSKKIREVKDLIHELRLAGATPQETYSVSYESAAMKAIRAANSGSSSTWGYTLAEYDKPIVEKDEPIAQAWGKPKPQSDYPLRLITETERESIRNYPNFIDNYIDAARRIYDEPNMPIHYVNAWSALSTAIGDRGKIYLDQAVIPLNLWTLKMADSAAGKSDANKFHSDVVDVCRPGGYGDVFIGSDASAEALTEVLMERDGRTSLVNRDEAHSFLEASSRPGAYEYKTRQLYLELYDGNVSRAVRKGMERDKVGERAWSNFILSLQGTWAKVTESMDEGDIESGFIGRFLVAVGDGPKITRESLTLRFASEYQVNNNGGRHPLIDAFGGHVRKAADDISRGAMVKPANDAVVERLTDIRIALRDYAESHPLAGHLRGVLLRVGVNIFKGAALLALSEGRTLVEMEDLLLAAKSGEHWLKSSVLLAEAVSSSEYRRLVEYVAERVSVRPMSEGTLMKQPKLRNAKTYEAVEIIQRAEKEGLIEFDASTKRYREVEK